MDKDFNLWTTHWKPEDGISYWIRNPKVENVYVITNLEELHKAGEMKPTAFSRAFTFIMGWTKYVPRKESVPVVPLTPYAFHEAVIDHVETVIERTDADGNEL